MVGRRLEIELLGTSASAVRAFNETATAADKAAKQSAATFDKSTSKIGGLFGKLDSQLGNFGIPFTGALGAVGAKFDEAEAKGGKFGDKLSALGGAISAAAVVGLGAVAIEGVHLADQFDASHARLETAVKNIGQSFDEESGKIDGADKKLEQLGFTNIDTENSLSRLVLATKDVGKATGLMGLSADIARARNLDLSTATDLLVKVEAGRYTQLGRLGIATKEQIAGFHSSADAVQFLTDKFKGQAGAYADTFAGKLEVLKATAEDFGIKVGQVVIPQIEHLATGLVAGVDAFQSANDATGGFLGKLTVAATAIPVVVFAVGKLEAAGVALKASLLADTIEVDALSAAETANVGAVTAMAAAQNEAAVSVGFLGTGLSTAGAAGIAAGVGFLSFEGTTALLNATIGPTSRNVGDLSTSLTTLGKTGQTSGALVKDFGTSLKGLAGDVNTIQGSLVQKGFGLAPSAGQAVEDIKSVNKALQDTLQTQGPIAARAAYGQLADQLIRSGDSAEYVGKAFGDTLENINAAAASETDAQKATDGLTTAQNKLATDIASGTASSHQLALDYLGVRDAAAKNTAEQKKLADATKTVDKVTGATVQSLDKLRAVAGPAAGAIAEAANLTTDQVDALREAADAMNKSVDSSFASASTAVSDFAGKATVSFKDFAAEEYKQLLATQNWATNLGKLADLGLNQGLLKQLDAAGPKASGEIQSILDNVKNGSITTLNSIATSSDQASANLKTHLDDAVLNTNGAVQKIGTYLAAIPKDIPIDVHVGLRAAAGVISELVNGVAVGAIRLQGPYDEGGWIKGKAGQPVPVLAHAGEYVMSREELAGHPRHDSPLKAVKGGTSPHTAVRSHGTSGSPFGGGTIELHVHVDPVTGRVMYREIKKDQGVHGAWNIKLSSTAA